MENIETFRRYGLFDAKVPRYTSYPPANHFMDAVGHRNQFDWLNSVPEGSEVSVYVHIPFCKRLCWFCACRTQGTKTMRPVDAYVDVLCREIARVRLALPRGVKMARLHLGGGTPTILSPETMTKLLGQLFDAFDTAEGFEFSVEIDPTEASEPLLDTLIAHGLNRASLGVQDFAEEVQQAIGRPQSLSQTRGVIDYLRAGGVDALNLDLLYGLPHQTEDSFARTLDHVIDLHPDRLAIYGYAHVPWMSKRQVMIKDADLPDNETRFALARQAQTTLEGRGFRTVGIDHFAMPNDALYQAQMAGRVRRNFQGYTDDAAETLIGFGASAISRFRQGFLQNAVATSAYQERIEAGQMAGHKGYAMTDTDHLLSRIIEDLLCRFTLRYDALIADFPDQGDTVAAVRIMLMKQFGDVFFIGPKGLQMHEWAYPLVRIIASAVDRFSCAKGTHSAAI